MSFVKRILLLALTVLVVGSGLSGFAVRAQEEEREGIGISPTSLSVNADPGETIEGNFRVINSGTQPIRYRTYVRDFSVKNEEYDQSFEEPIPGVLSPVNWFDVANQVGELAPRQQEDIKYSISVPANTVPRGYYAVIFAETLPTNPDSTGVARVKRVGTLVYLTVNGGSVEDGSFLSFNTAGWHKDRTVKSEIRLENKGNVHFEAEGQVRLRDLFGRTVQTADIRGNILPSTTRKFTAEVQASLPIGLYRVDGRVEFLDESVNLGSKWILVASPLWLAIIILILVAWLVTFILWLKRRARRKKA